RSRPSRPFRRSRRHQFHSTASGRRRLLGEWLEPRTLLASIAGMVFNDLNQDGVFESGNGETPITGRTVYVDLNNNGALDSPTEPSQVTGSDGSYAFSGLPAGNVRVSQIVPLGSKQTGLVGPSDILVSMDNKVIEYTRKGDLVQTLTVPTPVTPSG